MHKLSNDLKLQLIRRIETALGKNEVAVVIKEDYTIREVEPKGEKFTLKELQEYVGGYIENYPQKFLPKCTVYCDEEGLLKGRDENVLLHDLYNLDLVGNVLIVPNSLIE